MEALKDSYGDEVDILMIVSRTHYSRTLTTVRASTGAAQAFLAANKSTPDGPVSMEKMLTEGWSASVEEFYERKGGRAPRGRDPKYECRRVRKPRVPQSWFSHECFHTPNPGTSAHTRTITTTATSLPRRAQPRWPPALRCTVVQADQGGRCTNRVHR